MKLKSIAVAVALAVSGASSFAADQLIDLSSGSESFESTGPVLAGGEDDLTFINLAAGVYSFSITLSSVTIGNLTASFNGTPLTNISGLPSTFSFAFLSDISTSSPFVLKVFGTASNSSANYAGTISATPVPEPETYALMLAGLGIVGFVASRRKSI